jgi:predicted Zn finger-like uncharacterized protein
MGLIRRQSDGNGSQHEFVAQPPEQYVKISCPSCEAKYSIGDDKVQSRLAKIRCRKCGVDIVIDGRVQPPTVSVGDTTAGASPAATDVAPAAAASTSTTYTIDFGESDQRQMTLDEVVAAYNAGYVTPETFVWSDGMTDWTALGQVPEIVDALNAAASAPASAPVEPPPASSAKPPVAAAPQVSPAPQPVSTTPRTTAATKATTRTQGRGGADLFGSIANAGSEEDMAQQQVHEPAAPVPTTGARNESSVLFSLSALTASAKPPSSATSSLGLASSSPSKDDSGLIDLKALTSQATDNVAAPQTVALGAPSPLGGLGAGLGGGMGAPLGGFGSPLGGGAPVGGTLAAPVLGDMAYPQRKNRLGLYILGAAGIIAIAVVLGIALQPTPPPPAAKVEPIPAAQPKAAEPEPEPIKPAVTEAKPPSTGEAPEASASAVTKAAPPTGRPRPVVGKRPTTNTDSKPPAADAPPPPKKPSGGASKCGCAPGDLGCAMRCAAKGG